MFVYLAIFSFNVFCAYVADRNFKKERGACIFFLALIVVTNTLLYGLRDFGVGVDSALYVRGYFAEAVYASNIGDFLALNEQGDLGYYLLGIIGGGIVNDPQSLLFMGALFTWLFLMWGLYEVKKSVHVEMWIYVLLFNLAMGVHTLNYMRQFCAMGLLFLGFGYMLQGKWKRYIFLQVIAYFFHSSSITFLIIPVMYKISQMENIRWRNAITICGFVGIILMILSVFYLLSQMSSVGIISEVYNNRYGEEGAQSGTQHFEAFNKTRTIIDIYSLVLLYLAWKQKALDRKIIFGAFVLLLYAAILHNSNFALRNIDRVYIYVDMVAYVYLAMTYQSKKIPAPFKLLGYMMFLYLCYKTITNPLYGVNPYVSSILGISG